MSRVRVIDSCAVGYDGATIWLERGKEYRADDPLVLAHADRFAPVQPVAGADEFKPKTPRSPRRWSDD